MIDATPPPGTDLHPGPRVVRVAAESTGTGTQWTLVIRDGRYAASPADAGAVPPHVRSALLAWLGVPPEDALVPAIVPDPTPPGGTTAAWPPVRETKFSGSITPNDRHLITMNG